jgi:hypothetical protein
LLLLCRIFECEVMPRPTAAGQHSFSVKYPIAFVSRDYYPGSALRS